MDLFKPVIIIGFRSQKNNSLFFIRRSLKRSYSPRDARIKNNELNQVSTLYAQQTAAGTTQERSLSTKNSRSNFTIKKLATLASEKVFSFFKTTVKPQYVQTEVNNSRFLIKQNNPAYSRILTNYNQTVKGFFAHLSEKRKYFKIKNFPTSFYLIDKLFLRNINNLYLFSNLSFLRKKRKKRLKRKYKFLKFITNFKKIEKSLLNKKRRHFFVKLLFSGINKEFFLKKEQRLKFDYYNNLLVNNLVVTSNNLKILEKNFKVLKEYFYKRELKFRTLGLQFLLTSKTRKQTRFERLFWEHFLNLININYFLPFKDATSYSFKKKYKSWSKAKRFNKSGQKSLKQPLIVKLILSYRITHNGLRKKKARRM